MSLMDLMEISQPIEGAIFTSHTIKRLTVTIESDTSVKKGESFPPNNERDPDKDYSFKV